MKERPIIFSSPMIKAILDGTKTMTRRPMKPQPVPMNRPTGDPSTVYTSWFNEGEQAPKYMLDKCPYGVPGDQLWVRETWLESWSSNFTPEDISKTKYQTGVEYRATWSNGRDPQARTITTNEPRYGGSLKKNGSLAWRPSIHMPRWASRITLEVLNVKVERVKEITVEDCFKEGIDLRMEMFSDINREYKVKAHFQRLWDSIYGKDAWDLNPRVWVISFKRVKP